MRRAAAASSWRTCWPIDSATIEAERTATLLGGTSADDDPAPVIDVPGQSASGQRADTVVLMLHSDFILEKHQIHGYVAFILDLTALHDLQEQIDRYLARAMGTA